MISSLPLTYGRISAFWNERDLWSFKERSHRTTMPIHVRAFWQAWSWWRGNETVYVFFGPRTINAFIRKVSFSVTDPRYHLKCWIQLVRLHGTYLITVPSAHAIPLGPPAEPACWRSRTVVVSLCLSLNPWKNYTQYEARSWLNRLGILSCEYHGGKSLLVLSDGCVTTWRSTIIILISIESTFVTWRRVHPVYMIGFVIRQCSEW